MSRIACCAVVAAFLASIHGCGSGGNDSGAGTTSGVPSDDGGGASAPAIENLNGSLEGTYFSSTSLREGQWLDLGSGHTGEMFEYDENQPPNLEALVPLPSGEEYVEVYHISGWTTDESTIRIKDMRTGLVNDEFTLSSKASHFAPAIRFSPNGSKLGLLEDPNDSYDYYLSFYTREGDLLTRFAADLVSHYCWLTDERIAWFEGSSLYVGDFTGRELSRRMIASVSDIAGSPGYMDCRPDGQEIAFEMVTDRPYSGIFDSRNFRDATVWRIGADGAGRTLVATQADTDSPRINNPLYSLDGNYLLVAAGSSSSAVIVHDWGYSAVSDDYGPVFVDDVITSNSPGLMYILPASASGASLLGNQSYPVVMSETSSGELQPYEVSSLHLAPGARLVPSVTPLTETIAPQGTAVGSIYYLRDSVGDGFDDTFSVMHHDAASGAETVHLQVAGEDFHQDTLFGISSGGNYIAHWREEHYYEKYLIIYGSDGNVLKRYRTVYQENGDATGRDLISAPMFSPTDDELLMFEYVDEETDDTGLAIVNWMTGQYLYLSTGNISAVNWAADGAVLLASDNAVYKFDHANGELNENDKLFDAVNPVTHISANADGSRYLYSMAGHIFHSKADGSDLVQLTAPPSTGHEWQPIWSPDGRHVSFFKDDERYLISTDSRHLRIGLEAEENTGRARLVTPSGGSVAHWIP